jgi:hypothetical protein
MKPRFRSIFIRRLWSIPEETLREGAKFPVGLLLREGGWIVIGCRPCEVDQALELLKGWKLQFATMAFRRHYPYNKRSWGAWTTTKSYILREDLQEVVVIGYKPPYNGRNLKRFGTKGRPYLTNYPTRWEWDQYWKLSVLWGYPRLEIWARPYQGVYDPKKWTRIGTLLDGMPITQSLWLLHAERFSTPLDMSLFSSHGGSS